MTIHKEGYRTILILLIILVIINFGIYFLTGSFGNINWVILIISFVFQLFITRFFRFPKIIKNFHDDKFISPADGTVVIVEEVYVKEYFDDKRIQVSIFMSANNVHINWNPVSGLIKYFKYHPGKYFIASLPKASEFNEHTTVVYETKDKQDLMVRQIAGFVARRIVYYVKEGDVVNQGEQLGFIKFGSRLDIFLPLGTKINVSLNEKVKGARTVIAEI